MTIQRGQTWGSVGPLAPGSPVFASDAELGAFVDACRQAGEAPGMVGLLGARLAAGSDLARTLGVGPSGSGEEASAERLFSENRPQLPVDIVRADLDGRAHWFVAHLVAHRRGWQGRAAVAMNAAWLGEWRLGPRAHPNDGLVDVTVGRLSVRARLQARNRARTGTHVPHPALSVSRGARAEFDLGRPTPVWLDGRAEERAQRVMLTVEPDALIVVV